MCSVTRNVEQPDESTGRLPDHRIAERMKRVARDRQRRRPAMVALLEARTENGRVVVIVFAFAAEKDQIKVTVLQFVKARWMLVVAGFDFGTEDAFDVNLVTREQIADDSSSQEKRNKTKPEFCAKMAVIVHAM